MNHLTTLVKPGEVANEFSVFWRNGVQKQGVLTVCVNAALPADHIVVAELAAMKHLLEEKSIFGKERGGKNLFLSISSGSAIRKLAKMQSTKMHLVPYARFLITRFAGAEIKVEREEDWIKPRAMNNVDRIEVNGAENSFIDLHGLGRVTITRHALERLNQRMNYIGEAEVLKQIRKIAGGQLTEVELSEAFRQKAEQKHGKAGRIFENKMMKCQLVIKENWDKSLYLATAYFNV
jgi:hypothetical protein